MRIGLFIYDNGFEGVDLSNPNPGNPGVGGSEYCFAMFLFNYGQRHKNDALLCFHINRNQYPKCSHDSIVSGVIDALHEAKENRCDLFICWTNSIDEDVCKLADELQIGLVGWAHNFVGTALLKLLKKHEYFYRVVFVGKEQHDKCVDDLAITKTVTIENMYQVPAAPLPFRRNHYVVFTGALRPNKGFHVLAEIWPQILKQVPDAELFVAGNGKLYDRSIKLGPYGIAEESYEKQFMHYLLDDGGKIHHSVHFLGIVSDKRKLYEYARVGVVDPSCVPETLCLAAIEMESWGVPVVGGRKSGLIKSLWYQGIIDAVWHRHTGLLHNGKKRMVKSIVKLLINDDYYTRLSRCAPLYVQRRFDPELICGQWNDLFRRWERRVPSEPVRFGFNHLLNNGKIIRILNHYIKILFPFLPSVSEWPEIYARLRTRLFRLSDKRRGGSNS